jgi:hypothetical protein
MFRHRIAFLIEGRASNYHNKIVNEMSDKFFLKRINVPTHIVLKNSFYSDETIIFEQIIDNTIKKYEKHKEKKIFLHGIDNLRDEKYFINATLSEISQKMHEDIIKELLQIKHLQWEESDVLEGGKLHLTITDNATNDNNIEINDFLSQFNPKFELNFNNIAILRKVPEQSTWEIFKRFNF